MKSAESDFLYKAILIIVMLVLVAPAYAEKGTIVVIGDTEDFTESDDLNQGFLALTQWTATNVKKRNIVFLTHVGDIVQDETNGPDRNLTQWARADAAFDILDVQAPQLPYSVSQGNHDIETTSRPEGTPTRFHEFFGNSRFAGKPWYGGASPRGNGHFQVFRVGKREYLHLNIPWFQYDPTWQWAKQVLLEHKGKPTIISTHYYMDENARRSPVGEAIYERLVQPYSQVFLVLGGHVLGHAHKTSPNAAGRQVFEVMANYESLVNKGENWFTIIELDDTQGVIQFRTLTPGTDPNHPVEKFRRSAEYEFQFKMDWEKQFGP